MRYNLISLVLACLLCGAANPVSAEEGTKSKEHLAAATELLQAMQTESMITQATEKGVDMQIKANPAMAPYRAVMLEFLKKYNSWDALKEDLTQIYADEFSVEELREITAFYRTPIGQKVVQRLPLLMAKGMELGQRGVREHLPELQAMIAKEDAKLRNK